MAAKKAEKKESVKRRSNVAHATHKPAPEHSAVPAHDGPPHEPDPKDIGVEKPHAVSPKPGRKPRRHLSVEERLDRLEAQHANLVVKLRPHGIHVQPHDEQEALLEIQAQQDPSTE